MKVTSQIYFLLIITSFLSSCGPKIQAIENTSLDSIDNDCDWGIKTFNSAASNNVITDIQEVYKVHGEIPEDIKEAYPVAREIWNKALNNAKYTDSFESWHPNRNNSGLLANQSDFPPSETIDEKDFFYLLTRYRYGPYPANSKDALKLAHWEEAAQINKRLAGIINNTIGRCRTINDELKAKINPQLLPENIEDVLTL